MPAQDLKTELGTLPPRIEVPPPGPRSRALARRLRKVESRDVTFVSDAFPVFWEEARGANVLDVDGNVYVDLSSAFGVALAGHRHPRVAKAAAEQQRRLVHAMGDVHPSAVKVELLERLALLGPWDRARAVLASAGSEAVEIALKTALLHTGRSGILAFEGGYHGLTMGALATTQRSHFRAPFQARSYPGVAFAPFPDAGADEPSGSSGSLNAVERALVRGAPNGDSIGAVLVEPVQGRAGVRIPPRAFFAELGALARRHGAVVIADEVFTGLGRCGAPLASRELGLDADLVCLGKALGGGFPLSACLGSAEVFDAWPESTGEAKHTSTFLGHPVACAAALAFLDVLAEEDLCRTAIELGDSILARLHDGLDDVEHVAEVRGMGLLIGIELVVPGGAPQAATGAAARVAERALLEGVLVLPAGEWGHVVELAPPATMPLELVSHALEVLERAVVEMVP